MTPSPVLSVVIPVYNAASLLEDLYGKIRVALETTGRYEIIFVDDASRDGSLECLRRIAARDADVRVVAMGRNMGQQEATLYGLSLAAGEYCATMDDDGQHPPDLLPAMLDRLRDEALDIVYAVPEGRRGNLPRMLGSAMRDGLFSVFFPYCGNTRVSSYRVITRQLALRVLALRGSFNYFSAMVFQEPTRASTILYPFRPCRTGRSGYTFAKLLSLYGKIFLHYGPFAARRAVRPKKRVILETRRFD